MKQIEKRITEYTLTEQSTDCLLPSELKVKILSEGGQIWIQPQGYGEKCVSDGEGFPIGIEIWQGRLRLIVFGDINNEEPQIIDLENARETCRVDNNEVIKNERKVMSKTKEINIARVIYDAYPHSDLLPLDPDKDCRNLQALLAKVTNEDIGDGLFKFIVTEIVEGGEGKVTGAILVIEQAKRDLETVLHALQEALMKKNL